MTAVCGARAAHCRCANGSDCDGVHVCECGSSWSGGLDGTDFVIHVLPAIGALEAAMNRLAAQLASAPAQVEALRTPMQRALDILAPHLADVPLYTPHA